jgi:hypothetical protein
MAQTPKIATRVAEERLDTGWDEAQLVETVRALLPEPVGAF